MGYGWRNFAGAVIFLVNLFSGTMSAFPQTSNPPDLAAPDAQPGQSYRVDDHLDRTADSEPGNLESSIQQDLLSWGRRGISIARAGERTLQILQTANACSAWFREADADPVATFRTLHFSLEHGTPYVIEVQQSSQLRWFSEPYVAKVPQNAGPGATIKINDEGAFFRAMALVRSHSGPVTPGEVSTAHLLRVGRYQGGTLPAQITTLLHEFGHVVGRISMDAGDSPVPSMQNTAEVLRHCQGEVDASARRNLSKDVQAKAGWKRFRSKS